MAAALIVSLGPGAMPAGAAGPWPLGTLTLISGQVTDCPTSFSCNKFVITGCPNVQVNIHGEIAVSDPAVAARGAVMFFDGGGAYEWWADAGTSGETFQWHLRDDDHFVIVEVRFEIGWMNSAPGEQTGPAHLACRTATAVQWTHDNVYAPLGLTPWKGQCGFCITGNSGGSSAVAYPLSFYGLDTILDADIPTGGPDHAAITKACLQVPGYEYNKAHRDTIDYSYGWENPFVQPGPCDLEDPSWAPIWDADSIDIGGNDYDHPNTRVEFIEGGLDDTNAPAHGADYRDRLLQVPTNHVTWTFIPDMPHHISTDPKGQAAIEASLLKAIGPVTTITAGPEDPTNQTSATFSFDADEDGSTFACSLDDAAATTCASPVSYTGLGQSTHTFTVQGTDPSGLLGPPATWTWTVDTTPPQLAPSGLEMLDTNANGLVDQVTATFTEPLGSYTAGTAPWTLLNVPSKGTLSSVSVFGSTATLLLNEGTGARDTSVGSFTISLAAVPGGVADRAGNLASFGTTAPVDGAGPVPVKATDANGTVDGQIESGDMLLITFSESIASSSLPSLTTVGEADPAGSGDDTLRISGIGSGALGLGSDGYVTSDGASLRFGNSQIRLLNGNRAVGFKVGPSCVGQCSSAAPGGPGTFVFVPAPTLKDPAGNVAVGSLSVSDFRLF
jgi:hypothetical protein